MQLPLLQLDVMCFFLHYMAPKAAIFDGVIMQITKIYDKYSTSAKKFKKFYHNLGLCVVAVVSHLELNKSPNEADTANISAMAYPQKKRCNNK